MRITAFACAIGLWMIAWKVFGIKADYPQSTIAESLLGWPLVLIGAGLMLVSLLGTPRRYLPGPLIYLGRISYGMYLIHIFFFWIVFDKARPWLTRATEGAGFGGWRDNIGMGIAFVATVILASLLYRYFETPFLKLKQRYTKVPSRD